MTVFEKIKEAYVLARYEERQKIVKYLEKHYEGSRIKVVTRGGRGQRDYTSGGELSKKSYDLSNWMYVELRDKNKNPLYLISLQPFEQDQGTGNYHVLMDRIGIYSYENGNKNSIIPNMKITNYELPLSESDLKGIARKIDQFENEK